MAHFRAVIKGSRGEASRLGGARNGVRTEAQSWQGKVVTRLYEQNGVDYAEVYLDTHNGQGTTRVLYDGPVSGALHR